jgi:DNA polymerase (family 10)
LREDEGEIEAAGVDALPQLVELENIRGITHCHTIYSDGRNSIEELALAAQAMGMSYLTITDHSPTAHYAGGVAIDRLRAQWDEIARVQERVKIRLLRGTESDILEDGSLDYPDSILERFDIIIASVHVRHKMDTDQMTRRLLRALQLPYFKIWGHPLGRLIGSRPPFNCRMEEVLDAVAASRCAIEVNGDPRRLDLEPRWIRAARERGIKFVVSTDAHSTEGLENLTYGISMARRGWLSRSAVLNTLDAEDFVKAVRP